LPVWALPKKPQPLAHSDGAEESGWVGGALPSADAILVLEILEEGGLGKLRHGEGERARMSLQERQRARACACASPLGQTEQGGGAKLPDDAQER